MLSDGTVDDCRECRNFHRVSKTKKKTTKTPSIRGRLSSLIVARRQCRTIHYVIGTSEDGAHGNTVQRSGTIGRHSFSTRHSRVLISRNRQSMFVSRPIPALTADRADQRRAVEPRLSLESGSLSCLSALEMALSTFLIWQVEIVTFDPQDQFLRELSVDPLSARRSRS